MWNLKQMAVTGYLVDFSSTERQVTFPSGSSMSGFERLLMPGCTELPECRCGKEMRIASIERLPERSDAGIRVYNCPACSHEMRLTVWTSTLRLEIALVFF
jgi:hypothetical protein